MAMVGIMTSMDIAWPLKPSAMIVMGTYILGICYL